MSSIDFAPLSPKLTLVNAATLGNKSRYPAEVLDAIRQARVILYDAPVSRELLKYAPANCLMRCVDKSGDGRRYGQKEINLITLQYLFSLGQVVRIKKTGLAAPAGRTAPRTASGGEPDEVLYAQKFRIETEVIVAAEFQPFVQPSLPYLLDEGLKLAV